METDQSPNQAQLAEEKYLQLFVSKVADYAIYMLSPTGHVRSWNAGAQRFKGYREDEILGQHFSRFYTEEDRAINRPAYALQTALDQGKFEDEGWRMRKDGTRFWASVVIDPIYDEQGELLGFAKITRDITERKETEEALRISEERFRLLVQGVSDYAIYMLSPAGQITNWNMGAERIKGYQEDEVVGTHFSRFYTQEDRNQGRPARALALARLEGRFENEGWRVRKDGSRFWAHVIIDALYSPLGELLGFAKITRDITERREAAQALERAREALFQSQKLEAIGKLTGGIAHDFNNLLAVVINGLEILSPKLENTPQARILESMRRAANRGSALNRQLLSFARRQPLQQTRNDLNQVIGSFEAVLRRACDASVAFEMHLSPQLDPVVIDVPQFEAALLNLVSNAKDAMPEGGTLSISTDKVQLGSDQIGKLQAGAYVRVGIRDTGVGMSQDVAGQAIEPFYTTKPLGQGSGMGLSQVYGLMQQSGGDLVIDSRAGTGTTIFLYLPALESKADGTRSESDDDPRSSRALIVDDQPEVLEMAIELFKILDYEVLSANNGKDALEIIRRSPDIDLLFTDVVMPGMNGVKLAQEALRINPGIYVLLTSGYPGSDLVDNGEELEQFPLIQKPYSTEGLLRMLKTTQADAQPQSY